MHNPTHPAPLPIRADSAPVVPRGLAPAGTQPPTTTSQALLGNGSELLIEHHGAVYRLRLTSLGKLILTK
jgi:hemin uptake protein HemP